MSERTQYLNIRCIPAYIKRRFKKYCVQRSETMRGMIEMFMEDPAYYTPSRAELDVCRYNEDTEESLFMSNMPIDTVTKFQAACAGKGASMQEALIHCMWKITKMVRV